MSDLRNLWNILRLLGKSTAGAAGEVGRRASDVGRMAREIGRTVSESAADTSRRAATLYRQKFGEDVATILRDCRVVSDILNRRREFEKDPAMFSQLYNVRVRPVVTAAILAAAGGGVEAFDETIARVTRQIFDSDQLVGERLAEKVAAFVGPEKAEAVNRFMDTVPGSDVIGGGWFHRIQHGHDAAGLVEVYREHGFDGLVQFVYHVFGRDFFTPAGIPMLPCGSDEVHGFLMDNLGLDSLQAADLITLNVEEAVARIAMTVALAIVWKRFIAHRDHADIEELVRRASEAATNRDFVTASALYKRALAINPQNGAMSFALGLTRYAMGDRMESFRRFSNATEWLVEEEEPTINVGGAPVSLRGVAAGMAVASIDAPARTDRHWTVLVQEQAMAGLTAFETVADELVDRRVPPPAHLSAAVNYYLAGRLVGGAIYLSDREEILRRIFGKLDGALAAVEASDQCAADVAFIRRFARAELLPVAVS